MTNKKIERAYPLEGGADEKLDYLAKQVSSAQLERSCGVRSIDVSLKLETGINGKTYAAGFSVACD
ncbi:hypothetical protein PsexTeo8_40740 [Pseudomonas extremaustralis]|uniref:hypothetical protein n=1 Tax=Pseudomonas extremaustralis TaxID=359110 RepID=UPI002AA0C336|nr:hypothetical protein [Pseudomonas extremaustralis]MDY7067592.1 hypothetical protein [Pseudomonas extremaustralis]